MHDLVVVGGGPAGLTATMYALKRRLDTVLVTRDLGGKANHAARFPFAERYQVISGRELVDRFAGEIEYLAFARQLDSVERVREAPDSFEIAVASGSRLQARALIVATGATPRLMGVPGEQELLGRGLGYSAVSYAHLCLDRSVVVVGDGRRALRAMAELAGTAREATLVTSSSAAAADPLLRQLGGAPNVTVLEGYHVEAVRGGRYARELVVARGDEQRVLAADAIFVELDMIPQSGLVADLVATDDTGRIKVDRGCRTSHSGIFAAGDVTDTYCEQVLVAIGEGAKAALAAQEYLLGLAPA